MTEKDQPPESPRFVERRVNHALRSLVREMLEQLREASRRDVWTAEEREQAELDLRRIMDSVRHRAIDGEA